MLSVIINVGDVVYTKVYLTMSTNLLHSRFIFEVMLLRQAIEMR